jgi:hypothetical protein
MKRSRIFTLLAAGGGLFCLSLQADWFPGDPHKMLYPQLPDVNGWDIAVDGLNVVADDFLCTQSGPITSIHFWGSWRSDVPEVIDNIHLSIHADIPAGTGFIPWSQPGELLWEYDTGPVGFQEFPWPESGLQGYYDPFTGITATEDHFLIWQYNITDFPNPFIQEEGTIYWLDIHVDTPDQGQFGWKTSLDHWNDDAVSGEFPFGEPWFELSDPMVGESLDMAFVIVPEPATLALWTGMAALALLVIRRRRA